MNTSPLSKTTLDLKEVYYTDIIVYTVFHSVIQYASMERKNALWFYQ